MFAAYVKVQYLCVELFYLGSGKHWELRETPGSLRNKKFGHLGFLFCLFRYEVGIYWVGFKRFAANCPR